MAAAVLWATARPKPRSFTRAQWRPVLPLALVYAVMNLPLCTAIDRVGLGLAVTLEFLGPLTVALAAGVLSSAVPLLCDLLALRRVPAQFFGGFMSVNPVFAALAGLVVLGQQLGWTAWLAIAVIVAVNTVAATAPRS